MTTAQQIFPGLGINTGGAQGKRWTSKQAYDELVTSGRLARKMRRTYDIIYNHPRLNSMEIGVQATKPPWNEKPTARHQYGACCTVLRDVWGVIREAGTRKCSITGKTAIVWEVVNHVPTKEAVKLAQARMREEKKNMLRVKLGRAMAAKVAKKLRAAADDNPRDVEFVELAEIIEAALERRSK